MKKILIKFESIILIQENENFFYKTPVILSVSTSHTGGFSLRFRYASILQGPGPLPEHSSADFLETIENEYLNRMQGLYNIKYVLPKIPAI